MKTQILLLDIGILLFSAFVITRAIKLFISTSTKLAHLLKISEYTISFLLISVATSLPEWVVAITSGLEKNSILSYGTAIGSNLALLTLIVAIPVLVGHKISTKEIIRSRDIYYCAFFLITALLMALDGMVSRIDGALLLAGYIYYSRSVLKRATLIESIKDRLEHTNAWKEGVLFSVSLVLLLAASAGIVESAIDISEGLNINLGYIGLTITALGTSLPEITFALGIRKSRGNDDEIMGDVIGSVVVNSTLVLGTAALIYPINLQGTRLGFPTILVLFSTLLLFLAFSKRDEDINKKEAFTLLFVYLLFLSVEYMMLI